MSPGIPLLLTIPLALDPESGFTMDLRYAAGCWVGGVLWVLGAAAYSRSTDLIGIARSTPVKNLGPILTTVFGIFIFREFSLRNPVDLAQAVGGSVLMAAGATLIGRCTPEGAERSGQGNAVAFLLAFAAGACFASYTIPLTFAVRAGYTGWEALFQMSLAIPFASVILHTAVHHRLLPTVMTWPEIGRAQATALCWVLAGASTTIATERIPMSIAWPLTNLSTLVTLMFGVYVFREISIKRYRREVWLGTVASLVGVALLALALK